MASASGGLLQDPQKFVDSLLNDLRTLSTEARRKHEEVKDASEAALVKIRNIYSADPKTLQNNLLSACTEIIHPLVLGCSTKNPKLVQISLQSIQRALQHGIIHPSASAIIVKELWNLTDAECEELKVLQTITLFVSSNQLVTGTSLAKCIVLAIKLNFSKDPSVINAASAAVRQLFSCVFERVVQEDGVNSLPIISFPIAAEFAQYGTRTTSNLNSSKMDVCATDGYLLLKDLLSLIRKETTSWLEGVKRFTMTLALELLESVLKNYPSVFFRHGEYAAVLRDLVCPQVLFILTGNHDFMLPGQARRVENEKPPFPVLMRCLRIGLAILKNYHEIVDSYCEMFMNFFTLLLHSKQAEWQSAAALEVIHKIVVQPDLLKWLIKSFHLQPEGPKVLAKFIKSLVEFNCIALRKAADEESAASSSQNQPAFIAGDCFLQFHDNVTAKRWILLDWLEKHEAGVIPPGYCISLTYASLTDITHSIYAVVEELNSPSRQSASEEDCVAHNVIAKELFQSTVCYLLHGLVRLLIASVEDSITESLLNCLSTVVIMACKTGVSDARDSALRTLCRFMLPVSYYDRFISATSAAAVNSCNSASSAERMCSVCNSEHHEWIVAKLDQVVAVGNVCPSPLSSNISVNETFSLTAKNMEVARTLIQCADGNGAYLTDAWDVILASLQHLTWVLGMKPLPNGSFRTGGEATGNESVNSQNVSNTVPSNSILTTAIINELPELNQTLNKMVDHSSSFDDVSLHHVIASLCKLSSEQMMVVQKSSREPSFFAVGKLLQIATVNLFRLEVFWRPITAHLVEVCGHTHTKLREWGSIALTQLVMMAIKQHIEALTKEGFHDKEFTAEIKKRQLLIMTPLSQLNEVTFLDIKQGQLGCVVDILQIASDKLCEEVWAILIEIVSQIAKDSTSSEKIIEHAHAAVSQIGKEFLDVLPFNCLKLLLQTVTLFGQQKQSMNIALSSITLLWHISDQIRIRCSKYSPSENQQIWLFLFQCLSDLCVDFRPPVRKSACDTLLQTVASHGEALTADSWHTMVFAILFNLLENVRNLTKGAATERSNDSQRLLVHHSRDTPAKQWAETTVRTLSGVVKIINAQRHVVKNFDDFANAWSKILGFIEYTAMLDNPEMSLAALKNFQELHFGKGAVGREERLNGQSMGRKRSSDRLLSRYAANQDLESANTVSACFRVYDSAAPLTEKLWLMSWESWIRIGKMITTAKVYGVGGKDTCRFVPGAFHWTTYLQVFPSLFCRVKSVIPAKELQYGEFLSVLHRIAAAPRSGDQIPFSLTTANADLSPTHEAVLECIPVIFIEECHKNSIHHSSLSDLFSLLLEFTQFAYRIPESDFVVVKEKTTLTPMSGQSIQPFAEMCLKIVVDYFAKVANFKQVIEGAVLTNIIKVFAIPMMVRYNCQNSSIWISVATAFIAVSRIGLPIARENVKYFDGLWMPFINAIDKFIFCKDLDKTPVNTDERKRFEFVDCQMIELLRLEILPYATNLPWEFMQKVIDVLNRASIVTLDPGDALASDLCEQRADLCRVSFDALLSLSQTQMPGHFLALSGVDDKNGENKTRSLGAHAISALLVRCKEVINGYARDEQNNGRVPLLNQRVCEIVSVLRAISALIEGLSAQPNQVIDLLYDRLVDLYPIIVQMVPCCRSNPEVQLSLMIALNAYQSLLNLKRYTQPSMSN